MFVLLIFVFLFFILLFPYYTLSSVLSTIPFQGVSLDENRVFPSFFTVSGTEVPNPWFTDIYKTIQDFWFL